MTFCEEKNLRERQLEENRDRIKQYQDLAELLKKDTRFRILEDQTIKIEGHKGDDCLRVTQLESPNLFLQLWEDCYFGACVYCEIDVINKNTGVKIYSDQACCISTDSPKHRIPDRPFTTQEIHREIGCLI